LRQLEREKEIPMESLIETIERALASAYKKNYKSGGSIRVQIEPAKGIAFKVFCDRTVVDHEPEEIGEITLEEAHETHPEAQIGDVLTDEVTPADFGRIAAQTAKQVVVQSIREVERERIFAEFAEREGEVVTGVVQRREQRSVVINIGKSEALLPPSEQVRGEPYRFNDRIKVYLLEVRRTPKGPQVIVSRTHPTLIRRLFELEVPEIEDGTVVIKSVAREPGARTKIAVSSRDEKVDPVGACVGHRGSRVQAVVNELYGEKIDIVRWKEPLAKFVEESLSPAKVGHISISEDEKSALVIVPDNQLSLAIGKEGQNVRLAARLTGLKIDIRSESQMSELTEEDVEDELAAAKAEGAAALTEDGSTPEFRPVGAEEEIAPAAEDPEEREKVAEAMDAESPSDVLHPEEKTDDETDVAA
jgi:N utilization substance protein A